jgi:hypothetical protein
MSGESPFLGVPLNVKGRRVVEFPLVSFAKVSKSLLKNGRLEGDFKIAVVVTDVLFSDNEEKTSQSSWRTALLASFLHSTTLSGTKGPIVDVMSHTAPPVVTGCPNQGCRWHHDSFICEPEMGSRCEINGSTCIVTICEIED